MLGHTQADNEVAVGSHATTGMVGGRSKNARRRNLKQTRIGDSEESYLNLNLWIDPISLQVLHSAFPVAPS
jgi:hypothetical protein